MRWDHGHGRPERCGRCSSAVFGDVNRPAVPLPEKTHAPVHHQRRNGPFQRCHSTAARARHINRPLSRPCTYRVAIVDVQADKIRPYVDDRQVFRRERRRHTPQAGPAVFRIMSETDRVQHHLIGKCPVAVRRGEGSAAGSLHIGGAVRAGPAQPPCRGDADAHAGAGLPEWRRRQGREPKADGAAPEAGAPRADAGPGHARPYRGPALQYTPAR